MTRRDGLSVWLIWGCIFLVTGVSSAAQKRPTTVAELALYSGADRQQILVEGAKKEGGLTFYTGGILQQAVRPIVEAFQKKYPYIKVEVWRADGNAIAARSLEEFKAGKHLFDVLEASQLVPMMLQHHGIIQPYYSPNLPFMQEGGMIKAEGGGVYAAAFRESGLGLGYNTKLINKEQVPKTYQDLLDPRWKGKGTIAGSETGEKWVGTILTVFGEDFVKRIAQQEFSVHMVSAAALLDMIVNGEYGFSPTIFDSHVINNKRKGAPVEWVPLEPVQVNLGQAVLDKFAPHPHAALLFVDFELSEESAGIHRKAGYNPTRKDAAGARTYKKFYGVKSVEDAARWNEAFDKLFLKK